jgi:putative SOS response-associated peptidase YedK
LGLPDLNNPRIPKHIHVRSEGIDTTKAFASQFLDGPRGIVVFRTFNEGKELSPTKTEQWMIDPGDGIPRGFAFLFQRFELGGEPPFLTCVQVTVPASKLIEPITDRMPGDPRGAGLVSVARRGPRFA